MDVFMNFVATVDLIFAVLADIVFPIFLIIGIIYFVKKWK
jgi:hypothetical protein